MDRRGFLGSIIAACAAPAIVRADSLMRIIPRDTKLWVVDNLVYDGPLIVETDFTMILAETFRKHHKQILENIKTRNAMFAEMEKWGVANGKGR